MLSVIDGECNNYATDVYWRVVLVSALKMLAV